MKLSLSTNGYLAVAVGIASIAWGAWGIFEYLFDYFSYGFLLFGIGFIIFGITDGFNDESPRGRMLFKAGILIFIVSGLILTYYFFKLI